MRQTYSISQIAEDLQMDRRTVAKRVAALKPVESNATLKKYHLSDVVKMIVEHAVAEERKKIGPSGPDDSKGSLLETEKIRLISAQADKIELELEVSRGQLIPADEVDQVWSSLTGAMRAKMLALPVKASILVLGMEEAFQIQLKLKELVDEALAELSNTNPNDYDSSDSHSEDDTEDA